MGQEGVAGAGACSSRATGGTERGRGTVYGEHEREQAGMPDRTQKGSIEGAMAFTGQQWPPDSNLHSQTRHRIMSDGSGHLP